MRVGKIYFQTGCYWFKNHLTAVLGGAQVLSTQPLPNIKFKIAVFRFFGDECRLCHPVNLSQGLSIKDFETLYTSMITIVLTERLKTSVNYLNIC